MDGWIYLLVVTGFTVIGFRLFQLSRRLAALEQERVAKDAAADRGR